MQVATRAMTPTGMYPLLGYSWELKVPTEFSTWTRGRRSQSRARASHVRRRLDQVLLRPPLSLRTDGVLTAWSISPTKKPKPSWTRPIASAKKVAAHAIGSDGISAALRRRRGHHRTRRRPDRATKWRRWQSAASIGSHDCRRRVCRSGRGGNWTKMVDLEKAAFQKALKRCEIA